MSTQVDLPVVGQNGGLEPRAVATISRERYDELARKVKRLSWLSLGAMTLEGAVAITAGVIAGSIALVGFGLDSAVGASPARSSSGVSRAPGCSRSAPTIAPRSWSR